MAQASLQGVSIVAEQPCELLWGTATCDRAQPPLKGAEAGTIGMSKTLKTQTDFKQ